jgi:dethiobiotin synthetase
MSTRGLFVTGTGTGVGKSVTAAAAIAALTAAGERVAAFKPAVSGTDEPPGDWPHDHELLARATGWQAPGDVSPYLFGPAVSPHLAAREAGVRIEIESLLERFTATAGAADAVICEGVGGLLVPLADDPPLSVLDFALGVALPVVVVTHPGLGAISDTRLTVDRLHAEGLAVAAVVICGWPAEPNALQRDNRATLSRLLGLEVDVLGLSTPARLAEDARALPVRRWLAPPP